MELASRDIHCKSGEEILILPIGDIQYNGEGGSTALTTLKNHIKWGVSQNAYFIGMGDYIDFASPSNRQRLRAAALYDTADNAIELTAANLTQELYKKALEPSRDRWLGLLEGHHYYQYSSGITTDMELCTLLRAQHLGTCAYIRLNLRWDRPGKGRLQSATVVLWAHHGAGSGSRAGSPLNKLDQLPIYWDADIYLMGHQSKMAAAPIQRIEPVWSGPTKHHLKHRKIYIAGTGSFSRAYMAGNRQGKVARGCYVEQKMLNPAALGGIKIWIRPRWVEGYWEGTISIEQ